MKFAVGYQLRQDDGFVSRIISRRQSIREVYFSWADQPSGRKALAGNHAMLPWEAGEKQREDLKKISAAGIGLTLLLNANCYGANSLSRQFFTQTGDLVGYLSGHYSLRCVTTTSPVIARFLHANFPGLDVRASVNMELGTVEAFDYLGECMDSYYLKRELNRDLAAIRRLKKWCEKNGKGLHLLANSGCLNHCAARQFHDNLVAHEHDVMRMDNAYEFHGLCREYLADEAHRRKLLCLSNWIRPEDIRRYEGLVDGVKLATRSNRSPESVVDAYVSGSYAGNLLELTEPDYSALFYPLALNSRLFPDDYFVKTDACGHRCEDCGYCERVYDAAMERMPADAALYDADVKEEDRC